MLRTLSRLGLGTVAAALVVVSSPALAAPAAHDRTVRVMSWNIHHGRGIDGRVDLDRTADVVAASGADVVGLQEVDRHWGGRSGFADQATELARRLHMHVVFGANLDLDPLQPGQPRRQYGTAILSEPPIHRWRNTLLPRTGDREQRGLLEALVTVRGVPVRFATTHLQHDSQQERLLQVAAVRAVVDGAQEPVVLTGDLNARPGTPEIDALTEDLVDAWVEGGVGDGSTFPGAGARWDYVLHSDDVVALRAAVLGTDASDHLPVTADLVLPRTIPTRPAEARGPAGSAPPRSPRPAPPRP